LGYGSGASSWAILVRRSDVVKMSRSTAGAAGRWEDLSRGSGDCNRPGRFQFSRCQFPDACRNAGHGDSPGWSGAEPWVSPPHDISPQRGERGPHATCSVCPFRAQRSLCGVVPGVPPQAFTGCPFGARTRYAPAVTRRFLGSAGWGHPAFNLGSGNWQLPLSPAHKWTTNDDKHATMGRLAGRRVRP
jgi:hypothetical protein